MRTKLWFIIALCLLFAACQPLTTPLQEKTPAITSVTLTARQSATSRVVATVARTPVLTPTFVPIKTSAPSTPSQAPPTAPTAEKATATPESPTPTTRPAPITPEDIPKILYFEADAQEVDPGDTIVLSWQTSGVTGVILYLMPPNYQFPQSGWDVAPIGTYTVTIPSDARNYSEFMLYAFNTPERSTSKGLTVYLRCPDPWFFLPEPDICPTTPLYSAAAEQHFEHGIMLWIAEQDNIIVLFDDKQFSPKYNIFQDEWEEGKPDRDDALQPPEGFGQPIRGFGLVWRTYPEVRDRLGWATGEEIGFDTIVQQTTRYKYNATYIRALDGNVYYLGPERSAWEKLEVQH